MTIEQFLKVRRDGKIIDELMTVKDMTAQDWLPDKVIELRWINESAPISLRFQYGVLAKVVPGRKYISIIQELDESGRYSELWVLNADGSKRLQIPSALSINGNAIVGEFGWLEQPRIDSPNVFGVIIGQSGTNLTFQLDIDAATGDIIRIYSIR